MIGPVDYFIIAAYFIATVILGIAARGRQNDIDDYFTAGRGLGGKLGTFFVGVSIAPISGLSLLALPSVFYAYGWRYLVIVPCLGLVWYILHVVFIPRLFRVPLASSYDFIENHFGGTVRTAASVTFVAVRMGWMAALIYAPTIVILTMLGLEKEWALPVNFAIGICCTAYAVLGGLRGVIVTDAVQTLIMMVGIAFVVGFIAVNLPIPLGQAFSELHGTGRLPLPSFSFSLVEPFTVWAILAGWTLGNLGNYMADQMAIQRFLATGSEKAASRSFGINVLGTVITIMLLCAIGIMLRVWYAYTPDADLPASADRIMPYFVAKELPSGISGLLMAAILAATMSAMTSGINALSGSFTNDFLVRFGRPRSAAELLRFARLSSCVVGLGATLAAGFVDRLGTIMQIQLRILGSFQGPLLGCVTMVLLGMRVRSFPMIAGMILGGLTGYGITLTPIDALWVGPGAWIVTLFIAWSFDRVLPSRPKQQAEAESHQLTNGPRRS